MITYFKKNKEFHRSFDDNFVPFMLDDDGVKFHTGIYREKNKDHEQKYKEYDQKFIDLLPEFFTKKEISKILNEFSKEKNNESFYNFLLYIPKTHELKKKITKFWNYIHNSMFLYDLDEIHNIHNYPLYISVYLNHMFYLGSKLAKSPSDVIKIFKEIKELYKTNKDKQEKFGVSKDNIYSVKLEEIPNLRKLTIPTIEGKPFNLFKQDSINENYRYYAPIGNKNEIPNGSSVGIKKYIIPGKPFRVLLRTKFDTVSSKLDVEERTYDELILKHLKKELPYFYDFVKSEYDSAKKENNWTVYKTIYSLISGYGNYTNKSKFKAQGPTRMAGVYKELDYTPNQWKKLKSFFGRINKFLRKNSQENIYNKNNFPVYIYFSYKMDSGESRGVFHTNEVYLVKSPEELKKYINKAIDNIKNNVVSSDIQITLVANKKSFGGLSPSKTFKINESLKLSKTFAEYAKQSGVLLNENISIEELIKKYSDIRFRIEPVVEYDKKPNEGIEYTNYLDKILEKRFKESKKFIDTIKALTNKFITTYSALSIYCKTIASKNYSGRQQELKPEESEIHDWFYFKILPMVEGNKLKTYTPENLNLYPLTMYMNGNFGKTNFSLYKTVHNYKEFCKIIEECHKIYKTPSATSDNEKPSNLYFKLSEKPIVHDQAGHPYDFGRLFKPSAKNEKDPRYAMLIDVLYPDKKKSIVNESTSKLFLANQGTEFYSIDTYNDMSEYSAYLKGFDKTIDRELSSKFPKFWEVFSLYKSIKGKSVSLFPEWKEFDFFLRDLINYKNQNGRMTQNGFFQTLKMQYPEGRIPNFVTDDLKKWAVEMKNFINKNSPLNPHNIHNYPLYVVLEYSYRNNLNTFTIDATAWVRVNSYQEADMVYKKIQKNQEYMADKFGIESGKCYLRNWDYGDITKDFLDSNNRNFKDSQDNTPQEVQDYINSFDRHLSESFEGPFDFKSNWIGEARIYSSNEMHIKGVFEQETFKEYKPYVVNKITEFMNKNPKIVNDYHESQTLRDFYSKMTNVSNSIDGINLLYKMMHHTKNQEFRILLHKLMGAYNFNKLDNVNNPHNYPAYAVLEIEYQTTPRRRAADGEPMYDDEDNNDYSRSDFWHVVFLKNTKAQKFLFKTLKDNVSQLDQLGVSKVRLYYQNYVDSELNRLTSKDYKEDEIEPYPQNQKVLKFIQLILDPNPEMEFRIVPTIVKDNTKPIKESIEQGENNIRYNIDIQKIYGSIMNWDDHLQMFNKQLSTIFLKKFPLLTKNFSKLASDPSSQKGSIFYYLLMSIEANLSMLNGYRTKHPDADIRDPDTGEDIYKHYGFDSKEQFDDEGKSFLEWMDRVRDKVEYSTADNSGLNRHNFPLYLKAINFMTHKWRRFLVNSPEEAKEIANNIKNGIVKIEKDSTAIKSPNDNIIDIYLSRDPKMTTDEIYDRKDMISSSF